MYDYKHPNLSLTLSDQLFVSLFPVSENYTVPFIIFNFSPSST